MTEPEDDDDEINDLEVFDVSDITPEFYRSKDKTRVTVTLKSKEPISEMKLYLILTLEIEKLERRLGITGEDPSVFH